MADRDKSLVDMLDVDNYSTWKVKMRLLLIQKGLWTPVTEDEPKNPEQDQKAFACIGLHMKDHYASTLEECTTSKGLWDKLEATYKAKSTSKQLQLRRELNALKKDPAEPLTKYVGRTKDIRDQMRAAGLEAKDHEVVLALLAGLPSEYAMITTILTAGNEELGLDEVLSKLLNVEAYTKPEEPKALFTNHGRGSRGGYSEPRRQPSGVQGGNQATARSETRECFYCNKKGHIKKDCRKLLRDEATAAARRGAQQPRAVGHGNLALTARAPSEVNKDDWVLDSGATRHITTKLESLVNVRDPPENTFITCANGKKERVGAIGDVVLSKMHGLYVDQVTLKDVLWVPKADVNLLSIPTSVEKGFNFDFGFGTCLLRKGNLVVAMVDNRNGVYSLRSKTLSTAHLAKASSSALLSKATPLLWHRRFGHLGYHNLAKLHGQRHQRQRRRVRGGCSSSVRVVCHVQAAQGASPNVRVRLHGAAGAAACGRVRAFASPFGRREQVPGHVLGRLLQALRRAANRKQVRGGGTNNGGHRAAGESIWAEAARHPQRQRVRVREQVPVRVLQAQGHHPPDNRAVHSGAERRG